MKDIEQYLSGDVFIVLHEVILTFESVDEILKCDIQMKATEQYFSMVLFIMLYKVVLSFDLWMKTWKCNHSNRIIILICNFLP